ncbi:MAG: dTDP-glucose 4,6-dehydratase [Abditibacteriota bacterium]|nr:dTDP-glucose 4,6-dehydratase [Abditibacteriota bacterium]
MNNTILVTGGAGFIGSNFIYMLLKERPDAQIVCVDSLTYAANIHTLSEALRDPRVRFAREDIRNREGIYRLFEETRPRAVVNFAAESHVDRSIEDPSLFLETNVLGTAVLMDACLRYGAERFHQVGTDEVYGDLPLDRPDLLFTEQTPLRASSPYSVSKASADLLVMAYHRTYGLPVTISRCSNNYGPYQFPEKLIPLMINNALHDRPLPVYGRGVNVRDWLYVRDHCLGILAALEKGRVGQVYNLGGHNEKSNIEIVRLILAALGKPESLITFVTDRKGHDLRYAIDPSKAAAELGWQPSVPFEEGIGMTVGWYLEHMDWLEECTGGEYVRYYDQMYGDRDAEPGTLR